MQTKSIEGFHLSNQQKHIWQLQQNEQITPYRGLVAVSLEGKLQLEILKIAIQTLVSKYEILRTTFLCLPGMTIPLQVINDSEKASIFENDFSQLQDQQKKLDTLFNQLKQKSFAWETKPAIEFYLVTLSAEKSVLLILASALIADEITIHSLVKQISQFYRALLENKTLADEPLQYADISEWQKEILEQNEAKLGRYFWQKQAIEKATQFKFLFEEKLVQDSEFKPNSISLNLSKNILGQVEFLIQKHQLSTANFLLACWQVLLWIISKNNQQDIIIAIKNEGRNYEGLAQVLGMLTKYSPIKFELEKQLTFREVLKQVHRLTQDAYEWQEYFTWEDLYSLEQNDAILPYCSIGFEFEDSLENYSEAGITFSWQKYYACTERFKIKLAGIKREESLILEFHYDANLYQAEEIQNLASLFETLLENVLKNPEIPISQIELLNEKARNQLLFEFNQTETNYPQDKCIHQLFEQQVICTPDKIAVVFEEQQLTYCELNERANQLAHYLQTLGIETETLVGICVERSLDAVIGMLGILKAGATYLPLEATMPTERLILALQDAQPSILLTQQRLSGQFTEQATPVICLDKNWNTIAQESRQNVISKVSALNLAYIIYTSGSTGIPKGVAVEHQQLINYLYSILERLNLPSKANFAIVSTFAADLGHTAIFPSLCTGGCLHIISQESAGDAELLADYFRTYPIDCLKIVPSQLAALLASYPSSVLLPRQRLILGGEALSWSLVEKIQQLGSDCQIFNHYGPTETTVGTLTYQIKPTEKHRLAKTVPLGRPIANTQVYILDEQLQPVPIGVPGELYIGGDNVARGYFNCPELTAECFIANPFPNRKSKIENPKLYKTGDKARYLPDGNIEFLGRIDQQVKIRGFRIELGEIEAVLGQYPGIEQIVVTVREDPPNDKRLVAYIVPSQQQAPSSSELRRFLATKLPDYMIPNAFAVLKTLPLMPNGKVNRQQLPVPELIKSEAFTAPRTNVEQTIADIWSELLKLEHVSIHDNFFELGGHSLLATQIISRLRQSFQVEIPLRYLFESPTIEDLAVLIAQKLAEQTDSEMLAQMLTELEARD